MVGHLGGDGADGADLHSGDGAVLEVLVVSGVGGGSGWELPLGEDAMARWSGRVGRVFGRKPC